MSKSQSVAAYLRQQARRRLDRVERRDEERNARCALALFDAAAYTAALGDDDPLVTGLVEAGCFDGGQGFRPADEIAALIRCWEGEPWQLLLSIRTARRTPTASAHHASAHHAPA
ncbi:hypothetical protein [Spongiactinospora sp. TRM90649]|uniref:hypothetical protein n=1 Tax=Spongiactinospora sp. TRM90649 TaxID=3031114 RepID=UPI0023F8DF62|nr:hypothetical protein [Spongiactinospora sp. TRM90649]MDF5755395.1 hypothetical protein [Spongiactinospora sp. TRM90649]